MIMNFRNGRRCYRSEIKLLSASLLEELISWNWEDENLGQVLGKILSVLEHRNRVARKGMKS